MLKVYWNQHVLPTLPNPSGKCMFCTQIQMFLLLFFCDAHTNVDIFSWPLELR